MKVLVITGSAHKNGTSAYLAERFIQGAEEAGHEVYRFDAAFKDIHPCIACEKCHTDASVCTFKDDGRVAHAGDACPFVAVIVFTIANRIAQRYSGPISDGYLVVSC